MKLFTKLGMTITAITISSVAQAASISGKAGGGDSSALHHSVGSVTASLVTSADGQTRVNHGGLVGLGSFSDTGVFFTALWVFNPSSAAVSQGKAISFHFTLAPSFVAPKRDGLDTIGGYRIASSESKRTPAKRDSANRGKASDHQNQKNDGPLSIVTNPVRVSDGGSTSVLLGTCLLGLQMLRRKL